MNQVDEALRWAYTQLAHSDTPQLDAQLLLCHVLQRPRSWLFAHHDAPLCTTHWQQFQTLIQQRSEGQPVAYLLGEQEFYGLKLKLTQDVLIPRPETELLVDLALKISKNPAFSQKIAFEKKGGDPLQRTEDRGQKTESTNKRIDNNTISIVDLGTGSGAIALALKHYQPEWNVYASDQSPEALQVAKENSQRLGLEVHFRQGNWLAPFSGESFHLIISNPPYIAPDDPHLQGDIRHEPHTALVSAQTGLKDLFHIIDQSPEYLHEGGWLLLEHGYNQAETVCQRLKARGFEQVHTEFDFAGNPRVSLGQWNN